jgi:hypothetical protein
MGGCRTTSVRSDPGRCLRTMLQIQDTVRAAEYVYGHYVKQHLYGIYSAAGCSITINAPIIWLSRPGVRAPKSLARAASLAMAGAMGFSSCTTSSFF